MGIYHETQSRHYEVFPYPDWLHQDSWVLWLRDRPVSISREKPELPDSPYCLVEFREEYLQDIANMQKGFIDTNRI